MAHRHRHPSSDQSPASVAGTSATRSIKIGLEVAGRNDDEASPAIFAAMRGRQRRGTKASAVTAAVIATALAGCGHQTAGTTAANATGDSTANISPAATREALTAERPGRRPARGGKHRARGLAYSSASAHVVQAQPPPGSCHPIGTGLYSRPDPRCTPGALNPAVTQASIGTTICVAGWTASVRPPESVTEPEKDASIAAYGDTGPISSYEYDHFVPLELGGAVNDPRNLWPEPGASPNPKDAVEDELNQKVCDGQITLTQAQRAITTNWTKAAVPAQAPGGPTSSDSTTGPPQRSGGVGARCTVTASYNSAHHDYDVYVNSNQPDQTVTVTDPAGDSHSWHTNSSGYADVYFHASADAAGQTVTARVGGASCSSAL